MKLIIQIPCFNEEKSLPVTLADLPRKIDGVDEIEILVIDDGSSDATVTVAQNLGVHHIVRQPGNRGLAKAFVAGIRKCVELGADIIVNTDADNQYNAADIGKLIRPILDNRADVVVGERPIMDIEHFSPIKKILQKLGSWVVQKASSTKIPDAPSGFRAISKNAAMQIDIFSNYTYTLESIIQLGQKGLSITSVPIRTNPELRKSRLVKSIFSYVTRSMVTIFRIFIIYKPLRFFVFFGSALFFLGFSVGLRFLFIFVSQGGAGNTQSLILAALLMILGFLCIGLGIIGDLISVNRRLLEEILVNQRKVQNKLR